MLCLRGMFFREAFDVFSLLTQFPARANSTGTVRAYVVYTAPTFRKDKQEQRAPRKTTEHSSRLPHDDGQASEMRAAGSGTTTVYMVGAV